MTPHEHPIAVPQQPLGQAIALHLTPGVLTTVAYLALAPFMMASGFPALLALLLATTFVLLPLELGYLLYQARRSSGTFSLRGIVVYREPIPCWQYLLWPIVLFAWGFLSSALASPVEQATREHLFSWLPAWFFVSGTDQFAAYSHPVLVTTFVLGLVVGSFAGPIVEELYFRGYLLPRLSRWGRWSPVIHAVLFSLYHFWTPWQNVSRILLMAPMTYLVWWKRNIYLAMLAHCGLNAVVWSITFAVILR
jgi:membrane protease YdiL (CAAX protease family)